MPKLSAAERASLPDRAFAYIDSDGKRRLPIHDEAHVRNALARFERVSFESDEARERARRRLLNAAKKYGIVPVGFITGQIRTERGARSVDPAGLPTGMVTFLMTDIEGSTALLRRLGDGYAGLLAEVRRQIRRSVRANGGHEVDARADEYFAAFYQAPAALEAAIAIGKGLRERRWPRGAKVRVRIGLHQGRPTLTDAGYVGLAVHTVARVCGAAHGGQILVTARTRKAAIRSLPGGASFRRAGAFKLAGLPGEQALFELILA
jgi:class 3 adenylate cyclase